MDNALLKGKASRALQRDPNEATRNKSPLSGVVPFWGTFLPEKYSDRKTLTQQH